MVRFGSPIRVVLKKLPAKFYKLPSGKEPVREWLKSLGPEDRKAIGSDIATVEYGWPMGMPVCRPLGAGLFEVRSGLPSHRIARVLFMTLDKEMVLLHGFIKKTRKTPPEDLALARRRMEDVQRESQ